MKEIMYSQSSVLIVSGLVIFMLAAMEGGFRSGRRKHANATEAIVQANAIGTTYLRARLLPGGMQDEVRALLRRYLDVRIQEGRVDATEPDLHESLMHQAKLMEAQLWSHAVRAAEQDSRVVTSGLFIQSLNELIDSSGTRNAALNRHVPEIVLYLMFATIVLTTVTLGCASGIAGHRVTLAAFVLAMLIALVGYLILDLGRPRRGEIQVSHESMPSLQQTIAGVPGDIGQPDSPPDSPQASRR